MGQSWARPRSRLCPPRPRPHLGDDGDPRPKRVQPHVGDGDPVDPDPALGCLQEPQQAPGQGGLSGPRPADDAHLSGGGGTRLVLTSPGQKKAGHSPEGS